MQGETEGKGPRRLIEVSLDFGKCSHADGVNKYWTGISHHLQREVGGGDWEREESKGKTKERSNAKDINAHKQVQIADHSSHQINFK